MPFGKRVILAAVAVAAAVHLEAAAARADGAIAVGTTGDVVKHGIAFGMVVNEPLQKAIEAALGHCRTFPAKEAAKHCKVVATLSRECYAVAYDPAPGTPGAGWGVGKDQSEADARATTMCQETAGETRRSFCRVEAQGCDTRN